MLDNISIHAPHAGCDVHTACHRCQVSISIHAPHAGCDTIRESPSGKIPLFQSTHPMRGATFPRTIFSLWYSDFNPRTPCGVRRVRLMMRNSATIISIHAPHAGCDLYRVTYYNSNMISIHAPHAGCDA